MRISNSLIVLEPFPICLERPLPWPSRANDSWNFACVARWEPGWKGQDVLFESLGRPEWKNRDWRLRLYGEGKDEAYLRELADFYSIQDKIDFIGFVKDRLEIWRKNHIQVFPTRGEGGPMVLTEGMMCGRPAIITKCGHVEKYVENGINGFVADFSTADIFARAMEEAWARRHEWEAMGKLAHQKLYSANGFNPYNELYEIVLHVKSNF